MDIHGALWRLAAAILFIALVLLPPAAVAQEPPCERDCVLTCITQHTHENHEARVACIRTCMDVCHF